MTSSPTFRADKLKCPLCNAPLAQQEKQLRCPQNHSFDIAKQGYVNLLPVQQKRSKSPGDDKAMVLARKDFLSAGFYQPLADRIAELFVEHIVKHQLQDCCLLDAGSGEGYYCAHFEKQVHANSTVKELTIYGIDISKPAVIEACKRSKSINWLVASLKSIPLQPGTANFILSVFSPIQSTAFLETLSNDGVLLVVTPGTSHLNSLKEKLYDQVNPFDEEKPVALLNKQWQLIHKEKLGFPLQLKSSEMIQALLTMTPHTWRISPDKKTRLKALNELSCEADFLITLWQKKPHD